ncbi:hypothetical protein MNV49_007427 [Pseudohyphozyma bogoriensis]|nr:hypothetical protein MNV49_007427 [Pseudohyphozyma bogoriensis]
MRVVAFLSFLLLSTLTVAAPLATPTTTEDGAPAGLMDVRSLYGDLGTNAERFARGLPPLPPKSFKQRKIGTSGSTRMLPSETETEDEERYVEAKTAHHHKTRPSASP